jgi:type II secretory pathway pseudopilin PulG
MRNMRDQRGAALLMVIGVVAALAVLAGALVLLTGNAQSNTANDRDRAKAFNMAEAAADAALAKIGRDWPFTSPVSFSAADKTAFLARFPASEFAHPTVSVTYFDDQDTNGDLHITLADGLPAATYSMDANKNKLIYIEVQASVGGKKARIQLEAQRNALDTKLPRGIAVATDGNIDGNNHKVSIGADPAHGGYMAPDQTTLQILAGGSIYPDSPDPAIIPPSNQHSGLGPGVVDGVLTPEVIQGLVAAAQTQGTWYSDIASEQTLGAKPLGAQGTLTDAQLVGAPVVVETTGALKLAGNGVFNGDGVGANAPPGILIVIGPHTMYPDDPTKTGVSQGIDLAGNGTYYGIVYTDGGLWGTGTINIVGMALAKGTVDLTGDRRIDYNDNVVVNSYSVVQLTAQIVPNTWRQIHPL